MLNFITVVFDGTSPTFYHRKTEKVFFLTTRDVQCLHHGWHGTHQYDIHVLATHASTCWHMCGTASQ